MDLWTYKDFNTKDWIIYDNKTEKNICHCDTENEAKQVIKLLNLYYQRKANCCKCGCELKAVPGQPLGSTFVLDWKGNYYCMNCDGEFGDGDERIFEDWMIREEWLDVKERLK